VYEIIVPHLKFPKEVQVVLHHTNDNPEDSFFSTGPHGEIFDTLAEKGPDDTVVIGDAASYIQRDRIQQNSQIAYLFISAVSDA
jgi:hypothetical protein